MRRTKFLLAAGLLCCLAFAQAVKPNFSGTWKLNNGRTTPYGPADRVYTETIEQTGPTITVTTKSEGVTNVLDGTFHMNGKPHIENVERGLYRYTKVSWENATLVFEITDKDSKKDTAKVSRYVRESWSLSPDGTVLTKFRRTAVKGKPIVDEKYVFDKQ